MENELLPEHALEYMLGGNATLIMHSDVTGDSYRVRIWEKVAGNVYYVYNVNPEAYIGTILILSNGAKIFKPKSELQELASPELKYVMKVTEAFRWTFVKLLRNEIPKELHLLHAGICSACGRPLTDPESVLRGLGPICRGKR